MDTSQSQQVLNDWQHGARLLWTGLHSLVAHWASTVAVSLPKQTTSNLCDWESKLSLQFYLRNHPWSFWTKKLAYISFFSLLMTVGCFRKLTLSSFSVSLKKEKCWTTSADGSLTKASHVCEAGALRHFGIYLAEKRTWDWDSVWGVDRWHFTSPPGKKKRSCHFLQQLKLIYFSSYRVYFFVNQWFIGQLHINEVTSRIQSNLFLTRCTLVIAALTVKLLMSICRPWHSWFMFKHHWGTDLPDQVNS